MDYARRFRDWVDVMLGSNGNTLSVDCGHDNFNSGGEWEKYLGTDILLLIHSRYKVQTPAGIESVAQ